MTESSGPKTFKRNGVGVTAPVLSDGQTQYSGLGSESRGGVKTYFHSGLKNTDVQTSTSQSVTTQRTYDAFGNVVSSTGAWQSPFSYAGKFGYQQDSDTGLKLLGHRYYDSSTGRFLTRDPIKDGRNWYSYCENSPIAYFDADGLAKVYISWRKIPGTGIWVPTPVPGVYVYIKPRYHMLLIIVDEESGETWVAEGKPTHTMSGDLIGNIRKRKLTKEENANKQLIEDDDKSGEAWKAWIVNKIPGRRDYQLIPTDPDAGNSNSWISELLRRLGYPLSSPPVRAPGWRHDPWPLRIAGSQA